MSNWFYYDSNGQKQGPYTSAQFKELAKQGVVTPDTMIETAEGKTAPARKVKGLTFTETAQTASTQKTNASPTTQNSFTEAEQAEIDNFFAQHGNDVKKLDQDGDALLHKAVYTRSLAAVKYLIVNKKGDVNIRGQQDSTPLHRAVDVGNIEIVKFLVSQGADVNAKCEGGRT